METLTTPTSGIKTGDGATLYGYSDRQAFHVVKVTRTTVTIQRAKVTLLNGPTSGEPDALRVTAGGFAAHTEGIQRWDIQPDPTGQTLVCRMSTGVWRTSHGRVHIGQALEHYDYNF